MPAMVIESDRENTPGLGAAVKLTVPEPRTWLVGLVTVVQLAELDEPEAAQRQPLVVVTAMSTTPPDAGKFGAAGEKE